MNVVVVFKCSSVTETCLQLFYQKLEEIPRSGFFGAWSLTLVLAGETAVCDCHLTETLPLIRLDWASILESLTISAPWCGVCMILGTL